MKDLTLVFRDKREGIHSIEKLFACLEPYFENDFKVHKVVIPHQPSGFIAIAKNILYARKHAKGVIHITGDAQYLGIFLPRKRTILTVHDCGYLQRIKGWKKVIYRMLWFSLPCKIASKITVISEATEQVLREELGKGLKPLNVVRNCVTLDTSSKKGAFNSDCPKILQIGTGKHKNLDNLIKAVDGLRCELKIVARISDEDMAELQRRKINFTQEFDVSDARIRELYQECDILFFASRYEGFGLPILEAQAAAMPTVTSNCSSMPAVAGEGAFLVDPESPEQIREAILTICEKSDQRQAVIEKGLVNVTHFSPEKVAAEYVKLYKEVAGV